MKREEFLKLAGISVVCSIGTLQSLEAAPSKSGKGVSCYGIQKKGSNSCGGVLGDQIALAQKVFPGKFSDSKPITDCAGLAGCDASKQLAFVNVSDEKTCFESGGFLIEKDSSGKLSIRDKNGSKS